MRLFRIIIGRYPIEIKLALANNPQNTRKTSKKSDKSASRSSAAYLFPCKKYQVNIVRYVAMTLSAVLRHEYCWACFLPFSDMVRSSSRLESSRLIVAAIS